MIRFIHSNYTSLVARFLIVDGGGRATAKKGPGEHTDGHGENDGGVVLGGNAVQRLEIPQLRKKKRLD